MSVMIFSFLVLAMGIMFYFFQAEFSDAWKGMSDIINGYFNEPTPPADVYVAPDASGSTPPSDEDAGGAGGAAGLGAASGLGAAAGLGAASGLGAAAGLGAGAAAASSGVASSTVESVLPGPSGPSGPAGPPGVFNVSSNLYTYYDAEPLCKALGAQLATYDQVKDAWKKGADWCNYGWVKGQMAVYPTSDDTYAKLQKGPAEQQLSCGRPGVNGGYFDNPELRYGVTCYGPKPSQTGHDISQAVLATPTSPDALEFDKKVAEYKSQANTIGILPFNGSTWN